MSVEASPRPGRRCQPSLGSRVLSGAVERQTDVSKVLPLESPTASFGPQTSPLLYRSLLSQHMGYSCMLTMPESARESLPLLPLFYPLCHRNRGGGVKARSPRRDALSLQGL